MASICPNCHVVTGTGWLGETSVLCNRCMTKLFSNPMPPQGGNQAKVAQDMSDRMAIGVPPNEDHLQRRIYAAAALLLFKAGDVISMDDMAVWAFKMADAMLSEQHRREGGR